MPNRIIREGIIESQAVNSLSWAAEVFFRRLLNRVDDFGRFDADASLLRAFLYPLKLDKVSFRDAQGWLREVEAAGLLKVYEVDGKQFLQIEKFRQQTRAKKSKYPPPPCIADATHMHSTCIADATHMHSICTLNTETETETETFKGALPREARADGSQPRSAEEVLLFMRNQPHCLLDRSQVNTCSTAFYNEMEAVGWTSKGQPVKDWRAMARAYLSKWQLNANRPGSARRSQGNVRMGCNSNTDYSL